MAEPFNIAVIVGIFILIFGANKTGEIANGLTGSTTESESSGRNYTAAHLQQANPSTFEELVAEAWQRKGYSTIQTDRGTDHGIDVIATGENETVVIQAKRHAAENTISSTAVQRLRGVAEEMNADRAVIATSSDFTDPAYDAAERLAVDLQNGSDIAALLSD